MTASGARSAPARTGVPRRPHLRTCGPVVRRGVPSCGDAPLEARRRGLLPAPVRRARGDGALGALARARGVRSGAAARGGAALRRAHPARRLRRAARLRQDRPRRGVRPRVRALRGRLRDDPARAARLARPARERGRPRRGAGGLPVPLARRARSDGALRARGLARGEGRGRRVRRRREPLRRAASGAGAARRGAGARQRRGGGLHLPHAVLLRPRANDTSAVRREERAGRRASRARRGAQRGGAERRRRHGLQCHRRRALALGRPRHAPARELAPALHRPGGLVRGAAPQRDGLGHGRRRLPRLAGRAARREPRTSAGRPR